MGGRRSRRDSRRRGAGRSIDRRSFVVLGGGFTAGALLHGCGEGNGGSGGGGGGGGGGAVIPTPPAGDLAAAPRPAATGNRAQQLDQWSLALEDLTGIYQGTSTELTEGKAFFDSMEGASRQDLSANVYFRGIYHGYALSRQFYERATEQMLRLDEIGILADQINSGLPFQGKDEIRNPQWVICMMERAVRLARIHGQFLRHYQTAGILDYAATVLEETDPQRRLLAYGALAYLYNTWVANYLTDLGIPDPAQYFLKDEETTTVAEAESELQRLPALLESLPMGPGYRLDPAATRSTQLTDGDLALVAGVTIAKPFLTEWATEMGAAADITSGKPRSNDILKNIRADAGFARSATVASAGNILKNGSTQLTAGTVANLVGAVAERFVSKTAGVAARCALDLGSSAFFLGVSGAAAIVSTTTVVGALAAGGLFAAQLVDAMAKARSCAEDLANAIEGDATEVLDTFTDLDPTAPPESIPIPVPAPPPGLECDQVALWIANRVAAGGVEGLKEKRFPPPPGASFNFLDGYADFQRSLACGQFTGSFSRVPAIPRTFANVEASLLALMYDFALRNVETTRPEVVSEATGFSYFRSPYAVAVRREPGQTSADVPAYTNVQLICSGVGSAPTSNLEAMDLVDMPGFPDLTPLDEKVPGVNIDVS